jgi:starch-binding outer membrane protein, SusD/RagB family
MKKSIKYLFLPLCLLVASCNDDFFDKKPGGSVSEETLLTEKGADLLLIGAYSLMDGFGGWDLGTPWGGAASNWTFGSIAGGDAYKGSEANDQPTVTPLEKHTADSNNDYVAGKWNNMFSGISRANQALKSWKALKTVSSEGLRNQRIAEARFLRGLYFFELKRIFNMVPYIDENTVDYRVANDKDIWPNIVDDFKAAAAALPEKQNEIGRATKGSSNAMLGKSYIYQRKYAEAKAAFDIVISSKAYSLAPKYHDNFNAETRNNNEGVIVVQQAINEGTEGDNGNIGDVLNFPHNGGPGGCCGFHQPSQNLVNAFRTANGLPLLDTYNDVDVKNDQSIKPSDPFTPDNAELDPRLDWTAGRRGIPYLDWGNHPGAAWIRDQSYGGPYSPKKNVYYKNQENTYTTASGWTKGYTSNNVKLMRYADLLLMAAECEVEVGTLEKAREYVNIVRKRAANTDGFVKKPDGTPAANYVIKEYTTPWTVQDVARKAVRHERRIEMGMEGHRFFDLVRWGVAETEKNAYFAKEGLKRTYLSGATFKKGVSEYFPIPVKAITLSAKDGKETIKQNPGYN